MSTVFISYRRESASGEARALFNDLAAQLGHDSVFMDVDSIALGRDFRGVLQETLGSCDVMLVLIDRNWADAKDERGRPRLENPRDYVRLEIEAALKRNIIVTPVLVQGAQVPDSEQLPPEITDLAYRNGFELSHGRWESDVREMVRRLDLAESKKGKEADAASSSSARNQATKVIEKPGRGIPFYRTNMARMIIIGIVATVPLAVSGYYGTRSLISPGVVNLPPARTLPQSPEHFVPQPSSPPPTVATPDPVVSPPSIEFRAVQSVVQGEAELVWGVTNADSVSLESSSGSSRRSVELVGQIHVAPESTTTYKLVARGKGGEKTAVAAVQVDKPKPPVAAVSQGNVQATTTINEFVGNWDNERYVKCDDTQWVAIKRIDDQHAMVRTSNDCGAYGNENVTFQENVALREGSLIYEAPVSSIRGWKSFSIRRSETRLHMVITLGENSVTDGYLQKAAACLRSTARLCP
jgi:hypothetical protein